MINYKAILTKSPEVCSLLSNALEMEKQTLLEADTEHKFEINISHGKLYNDNSIPAMYHNKEYYYAVICIHGTDVESYRLIIA